LLSLSTMSTRRCWTHSAARSGCGDLGFRPLHHPRLVRPGLPGLGCDSERKYKRFNAHQ
jgi:hypothetical protein